MRKPAALLLLGVIAVGCSQAPPRGDPAPAGAAPGDTSASSTHAGSEPTTSTSPPTATRSRSVAVKPGDFDHRHAMAVVRHLAEDIGPRHATSPQFQDAAAWAAQRLIQDGFRVTQERFEVPGGDSWGVPVMPGRSSNVVARPVGLKSGEPHLVVGAHLDTVPQSPGAEDNGSGVGVLLAAAQATTTTRTRLPVVWVLFGAEEPRGPSDEDHHFGSRSYVAGMTPSERRGLRGMISLDRVGVGSVVPVGSTRGTDPVQRRLLRVARRAGIPVEAEAFSRSSDHWSFSRARLPAARLGSTPYAGYHSSGDLPGVVDPTQLRRTGRLLLAWLAPSA